MASLLKVKNIYKSYGSNEVLKGLDLELDEGKIVGLLGPNASGKSTLIKLINGLLKPDDGAIEIAGVAPSVESKKVVSYLPERTYINDWMKVKDMIDMFSDFYDDFDAEKAQKLFDDLDISLDSKIKTLSKGSKEKVQLVLVMSRHAKLYILDEPIAGVDPAARSYIIKTILNSFPEGATLVIVTHLISDIEGICDEVAFINEGKIVLHEDTDTIRNEKGVSVDALFREVFKC
ncbi:ABC transporter ATP-binding protein [Peptostreptococcus sp. D1]|uniref:ABC transporter ATP-binding protein n=1 Tax=Peptostreptococcus sp. D1 TaxID=72304 RepID=UPI0008E6C57D|nr:ABC transporter ATP-binding protein [Peptostreptococcus sp. D1]SFE55025.1 ABC-2 type transport system ATP-binding protein [Peptostreptococcus sp. D1]